MARATHVLKARRALPDYGIAVGDSYYWWSFKRGGKHYSKTPPRRSQLTQSEFYGAVYDIEDRIADLVAYESLKDAVEEIANDLREIGSTCQEKLDNMPEGLQQGSTGELLQERIDAMESAAQEFDDIDMDAPEAEEFEEPEREEDETDDEYQTRVEADRDAHEAEQETAADDHWQAKLEEVQGISIEAP